ncbi:hypothetical protein [Geitlerinema sp. PCC 7407]|uniref:hypothetical protein n=1 Tax=Geitlerinema sp. PCC 7407 TaxID=1173025 RepID=UPI00029F93D4|nr:hypothetical protein [Geitlerinema sp. PCC 7407]AFY67585.1 hypothetical protein GEI7407_3117 [Geitlerinema sp. PCC 7407]
MACFRTLLASLSWGSLIASFWLGAPALGQSVTALTSNSLPPPQPKATGDARQQQRLEQEALIVPERFDLRRYPVGERHATHWRKTLWATAVLEPQADYVGTGVASILALANARRLSDPQKATVDLATQVGTQLYIGNPTLYRAIGRQFEAMIDRSKDPMWVAMALSALAKGGASAEEISQWRDRIQTRFPQWSEDVFLRTTLTDLAAAEQPAPPLADLLTWQAVPGQPHLYVVCQSDRAVLCRAVLKDKRGRFVREGEALWSVPLMLRSLHGVNWNFFHGQTPQGLYRIEGTIPQPDDEYFRAYGYFPLVNLFVPFEAGAKAFLPGQKGPFKGDLEDYLALLPPSWRSHFPIQQSFWAGKVGRSLFRIHGSGEAPNFFSQRQGSPESYGWNPTIGCLSSLELYDEVGQLQQADMPKILAALQAVGGRDFQGYMTVVEVPGDGQPIALETIEAAIAQAPSAPSPSTYSSSR